MPNRLYLTPLPARVCHFDGVCDRIAADNLNERIKGFKSQLGDGFTEVAGSPYPCDDDANKAVQLVQDVLAKNPDLAGFFFSFFTSTVLDLGRGRVVESWQIEKRLKVPVLAQVKL